MTGIGKTWISLGLLFVISTSAFAQGTIPERKTFTWPAQLKGVTKILEEAGIHIVYGPNPVPPPEGISEEAKAMWR